MSRKQNRNSNPGDIEARILALREGVETHLPAGKPLDVAGVELTPRQLSHELTAKLQPYLAADAAHLAASKAIHARDEAEPETLKLLDNLETAVKAHFGATSSDLEGFGIKPKRARGQRRPRKASPDAAGPTPPTP